MTSPKAGLCVQHTKVRLSITCVYYLLSTKCPSDAELLAKARRHCAPLEEKTVQEPIFREKVRGEGFGLGSVTAGTYGFNNDENMFAADYERLFKDAYLDVSKDAYLEASI